MTHIVRPEVQFRFAILLAALLAGCASEVPQESSPTREAAGTISKPSAQCPPAAACPACAVCRTVKPLPQEAAFRAAGWRDLPGWPSDGLVPSLRAFIGSCNRIRQRAPWKSVCAEAQTAMTGSEARAREFFETRFSPYRIIAADGAETGMVTGYYEPVLSGSRTPSAVFRYPVYGVPDDLIIVDLAGLHPELQQLRLRGRLEGRRLVPYYSRAEIEAARSLPARTLAWVRDPVELFFMQIQGSGQIDFGPGDRMRVGFAEQNGYPYRSLGRTLADRGQLALEETSMQSIKAWAAAHPAELRDALDSNPRYVFFRELPIDGSSSDLSEGPPGALGNPLVPGYSIAVDSSSIPLGAPVYLSTNFPSSDQPLRRLTMAQDTGGAIRGAIRADLFWGTGAPAGALAGRMRQQGQMWLLWPKGAPIPRP